MVEMVRSVWVLANIRRLFLLKRSWAVSLPKWTEAPDWWSDWMDRVMFNLSASSGFLHFSEFVKFFPKGVGQLNESVIRDWKLMELKMLTPRMEKAEKYLSFLFPIPDED
jgi:hypothetical protein